MWLALPYISHEGKHYSRGLSPPSQCPHPPGSSKLRFLRLSISQASRRRDAHSLCRQANDSTLCLDQNFHPQMTEVLNHQKTQMMAS